MCLMLVTEFCCSLNNNIINNKNIVLLISKKDSYHGYISKMFYLEEVKSSAVSKSMITIDNKKYEIAVLQFPHASYALMGCCEEGYSGSDVALKDSITYASYSKMYSNICPDVQSCNLILNKGDKFKFNKNNIKYTITVNSISLEYCKCLPEFDYNFSKFTNKIYMIKSISSINTLDRKDKRILQNNIELILNNYFISEQI